MRWPALTSKPRSTEGLEKREDLTSHVYFCMVLTEYLEDVYLEVYLATFSGALLEDLTFPSSSGS